MTSVTVTPCARPVAPTEIEGGIDRLLRAGDTPTAKERLAEVADRHPKQAAGATYWLGRLAADSGAKADAQPADDP